ncbi:hypothetical protein J4Q44_G00158750 [Coregonus suidteri]|uniref:Uncharacterized protein n=1 Tax=Coregonus suidteri TaxID=861788 RepID=A0AAN8M8V1_9TELE
MQVHGQLCSGGFTDVCGFHPLEVSTSGPAGPSPTTPPASVLAVQTPPLRIALSLLSIVNITFFVTLFFLNYYGSAAMIEH